ncbi:ATP synthase F0 subunit B [Occallatibacter savannae]|uniref:ATP synthase F0 subunit B n=1 Tax=Occallatibacter savannae TaxID=1002691 RepID=UPI000D69370D|nr:ATP synthase F0 subunit B [Occallatibacter savannae]
MEDIVQQVVALLLGAIPTILLFVVLVAAYQLLVQGPLNRVLAERRARTSGAVEDAHKAIADAEAKAAEYADKLRLARAEIFKMREQRAKQRSSEREAALDEARKAAGTKVAQARTEIDAETDRARQAIQGSAGELASQVVRALLPLAAGSSR